MKPKKNSINEYFVGGKTSKALEKYGIFVKKRWPIDEKIRLYLAGNVAFNPLKGPSKGYKSFNEIYDSLKKYWQVFRNDSSHWRSKKVFDVLTKNCNRCSRNSNISLINLNEEKKQIIAECLTKIKGIKTLRSGETSTMAISKFLHFFNPRLFPIYDNEIIKKSVLKKFGTDWKSFRKDVCKKNIDRGIQEYFCYVLWASNILKQNHNDVMNKFVKWFPKQVEDKHIKLPRDLSKYYATAFEFIIIGAAELTKNYPKDKRC